MDIACVLFCNGGHQVEWRQVVREVFENDSRELEGDEDVEEEEEGARCSTVGRRGCVAVVLLAEARVALPLIALFHAHVVHDEVIDDQLLRAHSPYALLF